MRIIRGILAASVVLTATAVAASAHEGHDSHEAKPAATTTTLGGVFVPKPASKALYGTAAPDENPALQRHYVMAHDGVQLYVETWLPKTKAGHVPPKKLPTVLVMTPYVSQGVKVYGDNPKTDPFAYFTQRGYAVASAHVRGTGESGGCLEQTSTNQIDDGSRIVEYLGRDAAWASGAVGMYGISYDGETQTSTAGLGDPARTKYLKAIVPIAAISGQYEYSYFDGVPYTGFAAQSNAGYFAGVSAIPGAEPSPQKYVQKLTCQPDVLSNSLGLNGDESKFWQPREYRGGASNIKAATLYVHGAADFNVQTLAEAGFYDRLPKTTPHKGLFGVWEHAFPNSHSGVEPDWERADWLDMVTAWYDRYLKGLKTGVESWPDVQVQASDGTWRAESDYPGTGGPVGQLALGPDGALGVTRPTGSSSYTEGLPNDVSTAGTFTSFTTKVLGKPLHLTGQPVLDLWVKSNRSDGHLAARIEVIGQDGKVLKHAGGDAAPFATYGFRSLQHLDPIKENWFRQANGHPAPVNTPIKVQVRFLVTDLVVPAGYRLKVTIGGVQVYEGRDTMPSGVFPTITVLHDCTHPSVLRFATARPDAEYLDVRTKGETGPLKGVVQKRRVTDGAIASAPVCGQKPKVLDAFVPTRQLVAKASAPMPIENGPARKE